MFSWSPRSSDEEDTLCPCLARSSASGDAASRNSCFGVCHRSSRTGWNSSLQCERPLRQNPCQRKRLRGREVLTDERQELVDSAEPRNLLCRVLWSRILPDCRGFPSAWWTWRDLRSAPTSDTSRTFPQFLATWSRTEAAAPRPHHRERVRLRVCSPRVVRWREALFAADFSGSKLQGRSAAFFSRCWTGSLWLRFAMPADRYLYK